jgi:hypothetical protein
VSRLEGHWPQTPVPDVTPVREPHPWSETAGSWEESLENFMGDHPKVTLAAAATIGLLLGWMVKRK